LKTLLFGKIISEQEFTNAFFTFFYLPRCPNKLLLIHNIVFQKWTNWHMASSSENLNNSYVCLKWHCSSLVEPTVISEDGTWQGCLLAKKWISQRFILKKKLLWKFKVVLWRKSHLAYLSHFKTTSSLYEKQEAISQKEMVFRFWKGIQSLRKTGVLISCAWEVKGICANAPLCTALICSVVRAWGFLTRWGLVLNLL